jgi:hypothetical protein
MVCRVATVNGVTAIVCGPRPRRKKCCVCSKPSTVLCDWKIGGGKTCDRPICEDHAEHVGDDKDLCPEHREAYRKWLAVRAVR